MHVSSVGLKYNSLNRDSTLSRDPYWIRTQMLVPIEWDSNMSLYCKVRNYTNLSPVDQELKELIKQITQKEPKWSHAYVD